MSQPIHFSGMVGADRTSSGVHLFDTPLVRLRAESPHVDERLTTFFHYIGHIWIQSHNPPQTAEELSAFDIREVIEEYRAYQASGGSVPIDQGLDLEASYFVVQILAQAPLVCLLNKEKEDISTPRMARVRHLPPGELIASLQRSYSDRLDTSKPINDQIKRDYEVDRPGESTPLYSTLVHDGETGHCIILIGVEQGSGRLVLWDPWPLGSLLCYENNIAGVDAKPVLSGEEGYWTISVEEMVRVLYAVLVPEE